MKPPSGSSSRPPSATPHAPSRTDVPHSLLGTPEARRSRGSGGSLLRRFHRFREINISLIYFAYYCNIPQLLLVRLFPPPRTYLQPAKDEPRAFEFASRAESRFPPSTPPPPPPLRLTFECPTYIVLPIFRLSYYLSLASRTNNRKLVALGGLEDALSWFGFLEKPWRFIFFSFFFGSRYSV